MPQNANVRWEMILDGVFDHVPGCRAPDYGPCSCIDLLRRDVQILRKLLWLHHGHQGLYGEMQCGQCMLDFKRDSVGDIQAKFEAYRKDSNNL